MQIEEAQMHVWQLEQDDFDLSAARSECLSWLTEPELQRYHRYQFDRHRKQLLLSRILMRVALSHYDDSIAPADWKFSHNAYGKPALSAGQNAKALSFNLSHSARRAVLVVSRVEDVGVDIEFAQKPRRVAAIARRYFSDKEAAEILALPAAMQQSRFYDLWTLKEAYIKACGMGLAIPLQHFSYGFSDSHGLTIEFDERRGDSEQAWQFWQLDAAPDYKLAVAARVGQGEAAQRIEKMTGWQLNALDSVSERALSILRSN